MFWYTPLTILLLCEKRQAVTHVVMLSCVLTRISEVKDRNIFESLEKLRKHIAGFFASFN